MAAKLKSKDSRKSFHLILRIRYQEKQRVIKGTFKAGDLPQGIRTAADQTSRWLSEDIPTLGRPVKVTINIREIEKK